MTNEIAQPNQTIEEISNLPVYINRMNDDGAYEEAHVDSSDIEKTVSEVFTEAQIKTMASLLLEDERYNNVRISDFTHYSTTGTLWADVGIYANLEGHKGFTLSEREFEGKRIKIDYKTFPLKREGSKD